MPLPSFTANRQWIVELDFYDETGGVKTLTTQQALTSSETVAANLADDLARKISDIQPPNVILAGRLTKPSLLVATPNSEAQVRKQLKIGFATATGNSSFIVHSPAKNTISGPLISNDGILIETNMQFIYLKDYLQLGIWLMPNGQVAGAYNGAVYESQPGKNNLAKD